MGAGGLYPEKPCCDGQHGIGQLTGGGKLNNSCTLVFMPKCYPLSTFFFFPFFFIISRNCMARIACS